MSSFDKITFVSNQDSITFKITTGLDSDVLTNGIDLRNRPFNSKRKEGLVFIGNMRTLQNQSAFKYFYYDILPKILVKFPTINLLVVGHVSNSFREKYSSQNVIFTGVVDNIDSATRNVNISICPVRVAAGIQNKILEYFALGMACVTTSEGFEGFDFTPEKHISIANNADQFASKIVALLENEGKRLTMISEARTILEQKYSWNAALVNTTKIF